MRHFDKAAIENLDKNFRANLINSLSGFKPANLIGTIDENHNTNLAIFSSVVHLGANPALIGFIQRPIGEQSHTYKNIKATGVFTINHIHEEFIEKAHFTSARFDKMTSEFDACKLTPEFKSDFIAPFVKESHIKIGLKLVKEMPIEFNNTILMIGQIEHLFVEATAIEENGNVRLDIVNDVAIAGLETYYKASKLAHFSYAKVSNLPAFE